MNRTRRKRFPVIGLMLLVGIGLVVIVLNGWPPDIGNLRVPLTASPSPTHTPTATRVTPSVSTSTPTVKPFDLNEEATTPADEWADSVIDRFLISYPEGKASIPADGLAWWHNGDVQGDLTFDRGEILSGGRSIQYNDPFSFVISIPNVNTPQQLTRMATVTTDRTVLTLTVLDASSDDSRWILSDSHALIALKALVSRAEATGREVRVAVGMISDTTLHFVLLSVAVPEPPTATPSPLPDDYPTLTPTRTPTPLPTPTPTREPDVYMGRVLAEKIDPFIDTADEILPSAVLAVTSRHARSGLLTWGEQGPSIGGLPMGVQGAEELTFYTIDNDDPEGNLTLLLRVVYQDNNTRFPDDFIYFPGQRMEEILFWLTRHAFERGGQLHVAYDDFGSLQHIIFIGFKPFPSPTQPP